ncbi:ATP-dependent RNA helicase DHX33-like [Clavelina lepadiformis]|uniref:ATP-dependent RNA helicase DHX33-like n=1 Tax=Clavelina lepadiformis TaxID=159417 RepID=UPI0040415C2D
MLPEKPYSHKNDATKPSSNDLEEEVKSLPIYSARKKLVEQLRDAETTIIIGETASGKTTQIPRYIFRSGLSGNGMIACTQPRRVAAITIAQRVAQEMDVELGKQVGYCVRFEDFTSTQTKIKYMTDGMLLRESIGDKLLSKYSFIILDEAHERTVHTDILFGIVKSAQKQRKLFNKPKLKLIVMSATMDVDHFSRYFRNAPVLYVEGRLHPIKIKYTAKEQSDYVRASLVTVFQIHQDEPANNDILVFLTGQEEIESVSQTIKDISLSLPPNLPKLIICPLYASLPHHQQLKAFRQTPLGSRKVVLSTNIAETSVTIKGIKFVIDTGKVKSKQFYPATGLDVLSVQRISQAQAWQRAGRAGRERPGVVYRLYTEAEFETLTANTVPEIQRTNLTNTLLQLMAIGINDVLNFDFIDAPSKDSILVAIKELKLLGSVSESETGKYTLTPLGRKMAVFPLEPKLSKAILCSVDYQCVEEVLSLAAMLSVDSVLFTPQAKREEALAERRKFTASEGDFIMLLNIYRAFKQNKGNKVWCYENFINARNMNNVLDIRKQLRDLCLKVNIAVTSNHRDINALRKCFSLGFFMNAAELQPDGSYRSIDAHETVHIHPTSCLFKCKPAYVVYRELVRTSKCYMRDLCVVDPDWLYDAAPEYFQKKLKKL